MGIANSISDGTTIAQFDKLLVQEEQQEIQAAFTATPTTGTAPVTVQFDASTSIGNNLTYEWDFGDGTTGTGQTVEHFYEKPNSYAAKLTVSNASKTNSAVSIVTVQSVADGDSYILEPDGVLVGLDGIVIMPSDELLNSSVNINISETQAPEHLPHFFGGEEIIGKYYKLSSPNLKESRTPMLPYEYIWIGIPVPDGVNPKRLVAQVLNPGTISYNYRAPHWMSETGAYDPVRNMIFFRHTFNLDADESLTIVLWEYANADVDRYESPPLYIPNPISPQSSDKSRFKIACSSLYKDNSKTSCDIAKPI